MNFEEIAGELYGLTPPEFTAVRNQRVKDARAAGDRGLAAQIQQLRKPTASAWLVNLLVREQPEQVKQLVDLGAALRQAQQALAGKDLVALSGQRQQVVSALSRATRRRAAEVGNPVSSDAGMEFEDTLRAALADQAAAEAMVGGRLTTALHPDAGGFTITASSAVPTTVSGVGDAAGDAAGAGERARAAQERTAAEAAVRQAERLAADAERAAGTAREAVQRQQEQVAGLQRRLREVEAEMNRVRAEESLCLRELARLKATLEAAESRAAAVQGDLTEARGRRSRLGAG